MNIKEHLQFFVLMIPTVLLVLAAVITLAAPPPNAGGPRTDETPSVETPHAPLETEAAPLHAVAPR
jgi:hypothetical protein